MSESHVVSGLASKRAELTGLIAHHQATAKRLVEDVAHIDATIKILAPDFDLRTVRAKEYRLRSSVFNHGEALVQVLDVMREAGEPITSSQIAKFLMDKRGGSDEVDYNCAAKHINNALQRLKRKGMTEICGNIPGKGHGTHIWQLI